MYPQAVFLLARNCSTCKCLSSSNTRSTFSTTTPASRTWLPPVRSCSQLLAPLCSGTGLCVHPHQPVTSFGMLCLRRWVWFSCRKLRVLGCHLRDLLYASATRFDRVLLMCMKVKVGCGKVKQCFAIKQYFPLKSARVYRQVIEVQKKHEISAWYLCSC